MIRYTPESQLSLEMFETPFDAALLSDNRWVKLSELVPWDKFASIYMRKMSSNMGRTGVSPRVVLGALIIKHKEKLDDRGVIASIQENIYMQYFVGLKGFQTEPVFDPSLFVTIRKRIGADVFDTLNIEILKWLTSEEDKKHNTRSKKHFTNKKDNRPRNEENQANKEGTDEPAQSDEVPNRGKLQLDATVADQYITYPTDTKLLNQSRKQCEKIIDNLYLKLKGAGKINKKPRTYRRVLDKEFLSFSKKKRKSNSQIRKTNRLFLEALKRDIAHINKMLDKFKKFPLKKDEQRMFWIVQLVYAQQKQMYDTRTHSIEHRIVSIFQPYVRPIPRGKEKSQIEFGSKLGVSLDNGISRINTLSWEAYNEGGDLIKQVEAYKNLHGYYPKLVQVDGIYTTKANRAWCKERGIGLTAKPLGRKRTKEPISNYQKRKQKKERAERNAIEGKFGQGKNGYELNKIRARLMNTSESWIAAIFFIMNLVRLEKIGFILSDFFNKLTRILRYMNDITVKIKPRDFFSKSCSYHPEKSHGNLRLSINVC
jgi:hypothetical protein